MKIFLGSDHAGYELKSDIREHLVHSGHEVEDVGPHTLDPKDDYPQFAFAVTTKLLGDDDDDSRGILICGSGQGMTIAANRVRGIRAATAWNEQSAKDCREDDNCNVLTLPARLVDSEDALKIIDVWLKTPFSNSPRHQRRLKEIEELYG